MNRWIVIAFLAIIVMFGLLSAAIHNNREGVLQMIQGDISKCLSAASAPASVSDTPTLPPTLPPTQIRDSSTQSLARLPSWLR